MIIGSNALHRFAPKTVSQTARKTTDENVMPTLVGQTNSLQSTPSSNAFSNDKGSNDPTFDEAFAKMMVNLKMATATPGAVIPPTTANQTVVSSAKSSYTSDSSLSLSSNQNTPSAEKSATNEFMDYVNQSDADKYRQELTGVSKEEYEAMSPEEKAAIDKKVEELAKEKAQVTQEIIKAKIAMAKAELTA